MDKIEEKTYFDLTVSKCPNCGNYQAESGWYAVEVEGTTACGKCGEEYSLKKNLIDRALIRITLSKNGKIKRLGVKDKI